MRELVCDYGELAFVVPLVLAYIVGIVIGAIFINE